jgi:hypothetical protein
MSTPTEVILVKTVETCSACPSQWDAWDADGGYWYLRFRHGRGTMGRDYITDALSFEAIELGGVITLDEFCRRIGVTLAPEMARP